MGDFFAMQRCPGGANSWLTAGFSPWIAERAASAPEGRLVVAPGLYAREWLKRVVFDPSEVLKSVVFRDDKVLKSVAMVYNLVVVSTFVIGRQMLKNLEKTQLNYLMEYLPGQSLSRLVRETPGMKGVRFSLLPYKEQEDLTNYPLWLLPFRFTSPW